MLLLMVILAAVWIYLRSERSMTEKSEARNAAILSYQSARGKRAKQAMSDVGNHAEPKKRSPSFGKR
jgi:hypothetical protein